MFKHHNITITPGKAWTASNGTQHPANWHLWGIEDRKKWNITEIVEDTPPDSRLYTWSMDSDGKITSTAKPLDDSGSGENKVLGVKSSLKNEVKSQQGSLLNQTDWAIIRKADKETAIPSNIQTWRDAIRAKATEMENAIDAASDTAGIAALWVVHDKDGNKTGILYDWPELGE
jgi:hypothetical protein|tara:strand:- start:556 stop:1077 length:522 start_codon:yes stop_codon:yes gene_type:complete